MRSLQLETMHRRQTALNSNLVDELNIVLKPFPVADDVAAKGHGHLHVPPAMKIRDKVKGDKPDHGGLDMRLLADTKQRQERRRIHVDFTLDHGYDDLQPETDDWREGYYAFDDDAERSPLVAWEDDTIQNKRRCRRTSWHRELHPNCNVVHEYDALRLVRNGHSKFAG
jgi:hypothetical protein